VTDTWRTRAIAGILAVAATAAVFWLWSLFGAEVMAAMSVASKPDAPPDNGVYTVTVLPAQHADCPKDKPCPK
jgi:hypothetical protein